MSDAVQELAESVSKLAAASSEELTRCGTRVRRETARLTHSLESATRCQACDTHISATLAVTKLQELVQCSVCGLKCCRECVKMSKEEIPEHLWHEGVERSASGRGPYCTMFCEAKLVEYWLARTCSMLRQDFFDALELYLQFGSIEKISKPFATKDGSYRKSKRILTLAHYAANIIGYKQYIKLITILAQGHGIFSLLLANDYISLLYPLLEMLEGFGIKGPDGLLRVWYYACHCELMRKMDVDFERGREQEKGVLMEQCPQDLLDYVGSFMGAAQWMYSAMGLPHPHDSDEWGHWYLSRLVGARGWTLLACLVDSTEHFGVKCPAFALVARQPNVSRQDGSGNNVADGVSVGKKEALIVIRGSSTVVDWKINMSDELSDFTYWLGSGKRGDGPLKAVHGQVHSGILGGVHKILDLYGMRTCLSQLLEAGYDVKLVGHSLGAATACLLAAEIKNGYAEAFNYQEREDLEQVNKSQQGDDDSKVAFAGDIPRVVAIGFGCPPCVDATLADALLEDDMFVGVVHRDDLVPRLSRYALHRLADEVDAYSAEAGRQRQQDTESLKAYAVTYGLASDMGERAVKVKEEQHVEEESLKESGEEDMGLLLIDDREDEIKENEPKDSKGAGEARVTKKVVKKKENRNCRGGKKCDSVWEEAERVLVLPGKVIHLTFSRGGYQARLCDHRLSALAEIIPIQSAVHNHQMRAHIEAMRSLRLSFTSLKKIPPPAWQPIFDSSKPDGGAWARCSVCDSDPCWPYISSSDAARSMAVHNCRACGQVVCCVCAPAGDKIPADGIGKLETLRDQSISMPFIGLTDKQRVCTPCYLHSYDKVVASCLPKYSSEVAKGSSIQVNEIQVTGSVDEDSDANVPTRGRTGSISI